jgi:hypothetical protein
MQVTYGDVAVVLEVGEEEPGSATKTMRRRRHPAPREVVQWMPVTSLRGDGALTACSDATARWDDVAAGRESVQRRENHQRCTCQRRHVGSRRRGPKAAMLWPKGATQRQPDARTVVGACSGTYLA